MYHKLFQIKMQASINDSFIWYGRTGLFSFVLKKNGLKVEINEQSKSKPLLNPRINEYDSTKPFFH